jgi:hypothetical protein
MRYIIVFYLYCLGLLPTFLRGQRTKDYMKSLLKPLQDFNDDFVVYVNETFYLTSFTGQVIYLEHILNDLYDDIDRLIFISDGNLLPLPPYIYNKIEARPRYIYNKSEASPNKTYLYNKDEYHTSLDFIVNVPVGIYDAALDTKIRAIVRRYKLAGKRFSIDTF